MKKLNKILSIVKTNTEAISSAKKQFGGKIPEGLIHICENPECLLPNREFLSTNRKQKFCSDWCKNRGHYIDPVKRNDIDPIKQPNKVVVTFRTTKGCKEKIEFNAKSKGLLVSEYLHKLVVTTITKNTKTSITEAEAISFLKKMGYRFYGKIITISKKNKLSVLM